jgi:aldose 1-epimerase
VSEDDTMSAQTTTVTDPLAGLDATWLRGDGVEVAVIGHGARIAAVRAPDRDGRWAEIALGLPDRAAYRADRAYLGACVGRYANRIAAGAFELDGMIHRIPTNEPGAALHGGAIGFDHAEWLADGPAADGALTLRHTSPAGDNGFPGTVEATVTYRVHGDELAIEHIATTDAPTVINMTNHTYWNLAGADLAAGGVSGHRVVLHASTFLPVNAALIPRTGPVPVASTPFDFRAPTAIGARLRCPHPQMLAAHGYDHTYVPDGEPDPDGLRAAAVVVDPGSGRTLELRTDQPGVQFYTGNMLDGSLVLRGGVVARQGDALCLEPQAFPDAPNRPDFPSAVLRPGQTYRSRSVFRFGVRP